MKNSMRVFVSCQNVDSFECTNLISSLLQTGFQVTHSPRNPISAVDDRWEDWYANGLGKALQSTDIFLIVVDYPWDSSTWMAIEADQALQLHQSGWIKHYLYFNPDHLEVKARGMMPYLTKGLPTDLEQAIEQLKLLETAEGI
jgi:hypothetical protein